MSPDLSVSIVTYNSAHCLPSLARTLEGQHGISWELLVLDNASEDGTPEQLGALPNARITIHADNVGFGRGHNLQRELFRGRHVVFLNPDVELPPGLFRAMAAHLDAHPEVGIVGPTILEGSDHAPFQPKYYYPGEWMRRMEFGGDRNEVAWISGCCMAIRRELLDQLGGFSNAFFLYFEETDLCLRSRKAGYRIAVLPDYMVVHEGGQSQMGLSAEKQFEKLYAGLLAFWEQHHSNRVLASMVRYERGMTKLRLTGMALSVWSSDTKAGDRFAKLRVRERLCTEWLCSRSLSPFPLDAFSWRIFLRHVYCALKWTLQGKRHLLWEL